MSAAVQRGGCILIEEGKWICVNRKTLPDLTTLYCSPCIAVARGLLLASILAGAGTRNWHANVIGVAHHLLPTIIL